jgi:hypothetical protein
MNKKAVRGFGSAASLFGSAGFAAKFAPIPHGVSVTSFIVIAGISSLIGYHAGTWMGSNAKRRAMLGFVLALGLIPTSYLLFDWIVERGAGGMFVAVALYFLFALMFLATFAAFGILQVKIFDA